MDEVHTERLAQHLPSAELNIISSTNLIFIFLSLARYSHKSSATTTDLTACQSFP